MKRYKRYIFTSENKIIDTSEPYKLWPDCDFKFYTVDKENNLYVCYEERNELTNYTDGYTETYFRKMYIGKVRYTTDDELDLYQKMQLNYRDPLKLSEEK